MKIEWIRCEMWNVNILHDSGFSLPLFKPTAMSSEHWNIKFIKKKFTLKTKKRLYSMFLFLEKGIENVSPLSNKYAFNSIWLICDASIFLLYGLQMFLLC